MKSNIFVFGSNKAGKHGRGAALYAYKYYGAIKGIGEGIQGNSYAIPTKDENLKTLPLNIIDNYISDFINFARLNKDKTFLLTAIGTGLAGYSVKEIRNLFMKYAHPNNIVFIGDPDKNILTEEEVI